jgi:putative transposase
MKFGVRKALRLLTTCSLGLRHPISQGVFTKQILDDLRKNFANVYVEDDHVHLLVNYPSKVAVSALVNSLKGVSSLMIRKKNHPSVLKKL